MKKLLVLTGFCIAGVAAAFAQSPYAGMQTRPIKAISEQQVSDLRAGRGMGLALAAELNGYPGPAHLLELADRLALTVEQRSQVQQLFDAMKQEALPIGNHLLEEETELDRQFAERTISEQSLKAAVAKIALTQGDLRETHLKYHVSARSLLSDEQLRRYAELRGYANNQTPVHRHHQ